MIQAQLGECTKCVDELRQRASETKKSYDEPAFLFLQILEHLREPVAD